MIPFGIKVLFYRIAVFMLKIGILFLPVREPRLFTGPGSSIHLCRAIAARDVKSLLIVTDAMLVELGLLDRMLETLQHGGVSVVVYDKITPDPTIGQIEDGLEVLQRNGCEAILAVGGGSSIDAAKVIAARATNNKPVLKMEGLFRVFRRPLTLYAVPTTAGTGSEVTVVAVVSDPDRQRKISIIDPKLTPIMAALDGELTTGLPPAITAATGMDALTHAVEAYLSSNAFEHTDLEALVATRMIMENLPRAYADGGDLEARQDMALAAYYAGVAFTTAGVGYVHAIAHNFGARYHTPHGLANAIAMPYVLEYSKPACTERLARLAEVSGLREPTDSPDQLADKFIARIRKMNENFGIPTHLDALQERDIPDIADAAMDEAHMTYAVPRYMDKPACEALVRCMLAD